MANLINFDELYKKKDHVKYINDYETELVEDAKGRYRKRVKYIGPYIHFNESLKTLRIKFIIADMFAILTALLLVGANRVPHTTGGWLFTMLPLLAALFPGLYLIMGVFSLPMNGKPMQRDRYMHSMIRAFRSSAAIIVFMIVVLISGLVYRLLMSDWEFLKGDIIFMICVIMAAFLSAGLILVLRLVNIDERELINKGGV